MPKKDHDVLVQLCQKVDDMTSMLRDHITKEDPLVALVATHDEKLHWLQRGFIGICAAVGTIFVGLVAKLLHGLFK